MRPSALALSAAWLAAAPALAWPPPRSSRAATAARATTRSPELTERFWQIDLRTRERIDRVLGAWALPPPPAGPFVRYTVPSLQLRRMLEEVRGAGEPFELEYTELDGALGDERWRTASAGARRVRVSEAGCHVLSDPLIPPCGDAELANAPLLWWERLLGAWSPHPIVEGMAEEMHCFGP